MKKSAMYFMLLTSLFFSKVLAGSVNQIIFFGDSLSDDGNIYNLFLKILPKSPPYFRGRFSNGPTWAEHVGKYYYDKNYIDYKIYALGGATTITHAPPDDTYIYPITLQVEIYKYLLDTLFKSKKNILFSLWIGGNDYLFFDKQLDANTFTTNVVNKISWAITKLIQHGGENFLIFNLPDMSRTPFSQSHHNENKLHILTQLHNKKLAQLVNHLKEAYPKINFIFLNAYELFEDVSNNPDKYNKRYHVNINNITNACWQGGYVLSSGAESPVINQKLLINDIKQSVALAKENNHSLYRIQGHYQIKDIDSQAMSHFILSSPSMSYVYSMTKWYEHGLVPCVNPNEYLYWDQIHPTEVVHNMLSRIVIEFLDKTSVMKGTS